MGTRRDLTAAEKADAKRLRAAWESVKESLGLNQEQAAFQCGWKTQGAFSQYVNGKVPLNLEALLKIAKVIKADPMKISPRLTRTLSSVVEDQGDNFSPGPRIYRVPLISWVQAGNWNEVYDLYQPGKGEAIVATTRKVGPRSYAVRVVGDSMENPNGKPTYPQGSIIIVDPDQEARHGKAVIVRLEDSKEATFKQLIIDGDRRYLKPLNPRYPIMEINSNATICGVVVQTVIEEE